MSLLKKNSQALAYCLVVIYLILIVTGLVEFKLWDQVRYLWETDFVTAQKQLQEHFLRFTLTLPYFFVAEWLNLPPNFLFSLSVPFLILAASIAMVKTVENVKQEAYDSFYLLLFFSELSLLSFLINGRMIFAVTGAAILINCLSHLARNKTVCKSAILKQAAGFFLLSVSSGTFIISFIFYFSVLPYFLFRKIVSIDKKELIISLVMFLVLTIQFYLFLQKNISFFGGGIDSVINMLQHGAGKILTKWNNLWLLATLSLSVVGVTYLMVKLKVNAMLLYITIVCLAGGLFGYSTLTTAIPSFSILCLLLLDKYYLTDVN